ncbi:MAG: ATP-binding protein [Planctomycetota bacterium]|nr:ATP-binding protein [Planctomycetota bacterium]
MGHTTYSQVRQKAPKRTRLRVRVTLPVVVMLAVGVSGLVVFLIATHAIQSATELPDEAIDRAIVKVFPAIIALCVFGLAIGYGLAQYIIAPLKQLTSQAESATIKRSTSLRRKDSKKTRSTAAQEVFGELGVVLEQMVGSVGSQQLDSYILDSVTSGFITINRLGIITSINPRGEDILGYEGDEVKGHHYEIILPEHPTNNAIRNVLKDGLDKGETVSSLEVIVLNSSQKEVLIGASVSPLLDEDGASLGIVLTFKDLDAVKLAQAQIQRVDQLATLGSFAAGMAHEIRNPLAALHGMVELLLEDVPPEDSKRPFLTKIQRNVTRLTALTENLLSLAHPGDVKLGSLDVNELMQEASQTARFEYNDSAVTFNENLRSGLPPIQGDSEKLGRAFLNIVQNAFQATSKWGKVTIETGLNNGDSPLPNGQGAVFVAISNTGSYIPPEDRQKLFTPFYTTKDRGVGLGLAITHQIVTAHSGVLRVESDPAHGTSFIIFLPVAQEN